MSIGQKVILPRDDRCCRVPQLYKSECSNSQQRLCATGRQLGNTEGNFFLDGGMRVALRIIGPGKPGRVRSPPCPLVILRQMVWHPVFRGIFTFSKLCMLFNR